MKIAAILAALLITLLMGCSRATSIGVGDQAPIFSLPDQYGKYHSLDEYAGKWLLVYFYPKDGTSGCTEQACDLRDSWSELQRLGAAVIGISTQDVQSKQEFSQENNLPFPVLADTQSAAVEAFDSKGWFGMAARKSFLISPNGMIAKVYDDVDPDTHAEVILRDITSLRGAR